MSHTLLFVLTSLFLLLLGSVSANSDSFGSNYVYAVGASPSLRGVPSPDNVLKNITEIPYFKAFSSGVQMISSGRSHSGALVNGSLYMWGSNSYKNLGDGTSFDRTTPFKLNTGDLTNKTIKSIACCGFHTMALDSDGTVYTWGAAFQISYSGMLGTGDFGDRPFPTKINLTSMDHLACGDRHSLAWSSSALYSWGENGNGQLGLGYIGGNSSVPVQVDIGSNVIKDVKSGLNNFCVLYTNGQVWCCGDSTLGQVGIGEMSAVTSLTRVQGVMSNKTITTIASMTNTMMAIADTGETFFWGSNYEGELGDGSPARAVADPLLVSLPIVIQSVHFGTFTYSGFAISSNGTLYGWGYNGNSQLGNGLIQTSSSLTRIYEPVAFKTKFSAVYPSSAFSLFAISHWECQRIRYDNILTCNSRGTCLGSGSCFCDTNYSGLDCSQYYCDNVLFSNVSVCSGHGLCVNPDSCFCDADWSGSRCSYPVCFGKAATAGDTCSGHGVCIAPGVCECYEGFITSNCSLPKCYDSELCLRGQLDDSCKTCFDVFVSSNPVNSSTVVTLNRMKTTIIRANFTSVTPRQLAYSWSYKITKEGHDLAPEDVNSRILSDTDLSTLVIEPTTLTGILPNTTYNIILTVSVKAERQFNITRTFAVRTSDESHFQLSKEISIVPLSGFSLQDQFSVQGNDQSAVANYYLTFSYYSYLQQRYQVLKTGMNNQTMSLILPPGDSTNNYQLLLRVEALNLDNGYTGSFTQNVTVLPNNGTGQVEQLLNSTQFSDIVMVASQVSVSTSSDVQTKQTLITKILERTSEMAPTVEVAEEQLLVVDLITKNSTILSTSHKNLALTSLLNIINQVKLNGSFEVFINTENNQKIANVISNVIDDQARSQVSSDLVLSVASGLSDVILIKKGVSDPATNISTTNFEFSTRIDLAERLSEEKIYAPSIDSGFSLSNQFGSELNVSVLSYTLLVFHKTPYAASNDTKVGPVLDIKFRRENHSLLVVRDLFEPILIDFKFQEDIALNGTIVCRYWNTVESRWKGDGCSLIRVSDGIIRCGCNHTTSFSAFVLDSGSNPNSRSSQASKIVDIVFSSLFVVLECLVLIGLVVGRNQQPIKSRFISHYFGIGACLVDAILQGWIRNALYLANKFSASDIFSYFIMIISNGLTVTALYIFLWQQVRYILLQNVYSIMATNESKRVKRARFLRLFSSRRVFLSSSMICLGLVTAIFAVFVGVAAHYNSNISLWKTQRNKVVTGQVVCYSILMIVISFGIVTAFTVDILLGFRRTSRHEGKSSVRFTISSFLAWDPLLFRSQSIIVSVCAILIIIVHSLGIATVVQDLPAYSSISIARSVLEIVLVLLEILAFGGLVVVGAIYNYTRYHKMNNEYTRLEKKGEDLVLSMLSSKRGYDLFFDYCQTEHSLENLLLWSELSKIRERNICSMESEEVRKIVDDLYDKYIADGSDRQVNISARIRKRMSAVRKASLDNKDDVCQALNGLYDASIANLSDTYTRFTGTSFYEEYMAGSEMSLELASKDFDGSQ